MKRKLEKIGSTKVEITCDIDAAVWKKAQEEALNELAKEVEIKGFRKGKAPVDLAKSKIDPSKLFNEAINKTLQPAFEEVLKEEKLEPFARPAVDVTKASDSELQLKFTVLLRPEVELGQYKGLDIEKGIIKVSKKEIDDEIAKLIADQASMVVSEEAAKSGDTVVIDFVGSVDGVEFDGGKAENFSLELGSNQFVPGFEDQLIGKKQGEEVLVKVTFPTQYVPELAGKDAEFKVKVHEVKSKVLPELNDELVKEINIPNVSNVEELRASKKEAIKAAKTQKVEGELFTSILDKIVENAKIEVAEEIIMDEVNNMKANMEQQVKSKGVELEQYLQITGQTMEGFESKLKEDATRNIRGFLVLEKVAELEKVTVAEADLELEMSKIAEQYKMELEKVKEILGKDMERFSREIRQKRIQELVVELNTKK